MKKPLPQFLFLMICQKCYMDMNCSGTNKNIYVINYNNNFSSDLRKVVHLTFIQKYLHWKMLMAPFLFQTSIISPVLAWFQCVSF